MIGWLSGIVVEREANALILDVNGVGYEVTLSSEMLGGQGAPGDELALWIHSHATSESPSPVLFGFLSSEQRKVFRLLLKVKGIGPKLAQAIVAHLSGQGVADAVRAGDVGKLCSVSGVGKKTAQQIILDLSGQIGTLEPSVVQLSGQIAQVASALGNLGFRRAEIERSLRILKDKGETEGSFDEVFRRALALLRRI